MVKSIAASMIWRGVQYAVVGATIGCVVFFFVEMVQSAIKSDSQRPEVYGGAAGVALLLAAAASVFSMPFAASGGAVLGWLLERAGWRQGRIWKARLAGVGMAAVAIASIFWFGAPWLLCGHGICSQIIENGEFSRAGGLLVQRLILALAIGVTVGWEVGGRLVRQKK